MTASEKLAALDAAMKDSECYHRSDDEWAAVTACALYRNVLPELVALVAAVERKHGRSGNISTRCFCGDVWPCAEDAAVAALRDALTKEMT